MSLRAYVHLFVPPEDVSRKPLLLLHRTGHDENSLVAAARELSPGAALLAPRGKVLEEGKPRFFRRVGRGQFDVADLQAQTADLGAFLRAACDHYCIDRPVAVGHSNGANIAWSLMFADPGVLSGAILFRPLMPIDPGEGNGLAKFPVLVLSGTDDKVAPPDEAFALPNRLRKVGADLSFQFIKAEHDIVPLDHVIARAWLNRQFAREFSASS